MLKKLYPLFAAAMLLAPEAAFAWGPLGHKVIARIAQDRLSPQAQQAIAQILGGNINLADIANCPDEMRYGPTDCAGLFSPALPMDKATSSWHFMNIPISAGLSLTPSADDINQYPDCTRDASGATAQTLGDSLGACVVDQVDFDFNVLSGNIPNAALRQKQMALMFLVHFVGDAHQPLHIADDNDEGGNEKEIVFEGGKPKKLHELWDDLIENISWQDQQSEDPGVLAGKLEQDLGGRSGDEVGGWTAGNFAVIMDNAAGESFDIAKNQIYPNYYAAQKCHGDGQCLGIVFAGQTIPERYLKNFAPTPKGKRPPKAETVALNSDYRALMQPIAYQRLEQAGVRLAFLLNQALGQSSATQTKASVTQPHKALNLLLPMAILQESLGWAPK